VDMENRPPLLAWAGLGMMWLTAAACAVLALVAVVMMPSDGKAPPGYCFLIVLLAAAGIVGGMAYASMRGRLAPYLLFLVIGGCFAITIALALESRLGWLFAAPVLPMLIGMPSMILWALRVEAARAGRPNVPLFPRPGGWAIPALAIMSLTAVAAFVASSWWMAHEERDWESTVPGSWKVLPALMGSGFLLLLAGAALRGSREAYGAFVLLALIAAPCIALFAKHTGARVSVVIVAVALLAAGPGYWRWAGNVEESRKPSA